MGCRPSVLNSLEHLQGQLPWHAASLCHGPWAYRADCEGGDCPQEVVTTGSSALQEDLPTALNVRHPWNGLPQAPFLFPICPRKQPAQTHLNRLGVPKILIPSAFQTSGPRLVHVGRTGFCLVPHACFCLRVEADASSGEELLAQEVENSPNTCLGTHHVDVVQKRKLEFTTEHLSFCFI